MPSSKKGGFPRGSKFSNVTFNSRNVQPDDVSQYSIRAGSSNSRFGGQVIKIVSVHRHPRYVAYPVPRADIAILKLATPLKFEAGVQPACLPHWESHVYRSIWTRSSGWGFLNFQQSPTGTIQTALVPLVHKSYCYRRFGKTFDGKRQLCAVQKASASCQGDTGSGLIWGDMLVGVATSAISCEKPQPAKYLNVAAYVDFIGYYKNGGGFSKKEE
jgi:Trypsin